MTLASISRYIVVRSLGAGGMGEVFLARDPDLDRHVAVKVLRADAEAIDAEAPARLRDEARALAALNHPGIVTVHEIGNDGDRDFITMEYVEGSSLREILDAASQALEVDRIRAIAAAVSRALSAAHSAGVLHRDIKPDNVMVEPSGVVKVVDFGIAHRLGMSERESGNVVTPAASLEMTLPIDVREADLGTNTIFGTPGYMAPEVISGLGATAASDVYSTGVMIYEALTGRLPYVGSDLLETLGRVIDPQTRPPSIASLRPDVPELIAQLVEEMLEKPVARRPSMSQVRERLSKSDSASQPIQALPASQPAAAIAAPTAPLRAHESRSRAPLYLVVFALLAASAAILVLALRSPDPSEPTPAPALANDLAQRRIAIAPIEGDFTGLGNSAPSGSNIAAALGNILGEVAGITVVEGGSETEPFRQMRAAVRPAEGGGVEVSVSLDPPNASRGAAAFSTSFKSASAAQGLFEAAKLVALEVAPEADANAISGGIAEIGYQLGIVAFSNVDYQKAIPYLEQAVSAKPVFPSAWLYLALSRGWIGAPAELTQEARKQAEETASTELERRLARAVRKFLDRMWAEAAATLAPMVKDSPRDRDLLYIYGEALFHDGQIADAIEIFERVVEVAPRFKPVRLHLQEVAFARRDVSALRRHHGSDTDTAEAAIAYLSGDFELAREKGYSKTLIGLATGERAALDAAYGDRSGVAIAYRAARLIETGKRREAAKLLDANWSQLQKEAAAPKGAFALQQVSRVALAAGLTGTLKKHRTWWRTHRAPINLEIGAELEIFSARLLGEKQPDGEALGLSTRQMEISDALGLATAGERTTAISKLSPIVSDPAGNTRDAALQAAYLDLLAAEGRAKEIARRCQEWNRPAQTSPVFIVTRARCEAELRQ